MSITRRKAPQSFLQLIMSWNSGAFSAAEKRIPYPLVSLIVTYSA
jgi:hypothetical protein